MKKYLRLMAALLALLLTTSFCATAQEAEAFIGENSESALTEDVVSDEASAETVSETTEDVPSGGAASEAVEPSAEEAELTLGGDETEDPAELVQEGQVSPVDGESSDATDAENSEEMSVQVDEPGEIEAPGTGEASGDAEAADGATEPGTDGVPEITDSPETTEAPAIAEAPEDIKAPEAMGTPEPTEVPGDSAVVTEVSEDTAAKQALEAAQVTLKLGVGEKFQIPELEGTDAPAYTSANAKVATVSATGLIKGKKRGSTTIVATRGAATVEYFVQVFKAPKKIRFSKKTLTLGYDAAQNLGQQSQLIPKLTAGSSSRITYSGYNSKIVSVSEDGVVTPVGIGTTRITAKTYNKKKASIRIKVQSAPGSLALNVPAVNISVGSTYKLKCTLPKKTTSPITFSSDNPGCVTVDAKGVLTAISEGTAAVTARSFNGIEAVCAVTVLPAPEPIQLALATTSLGVGQKSAPLLGAADVNTAYGGVTFSSSNKKVATVSKLGVIKAKRRGTATIRIKGGTGSKASVKIRVYKAPTKVTLSAKSLTLDQFSGAQLGVSLPKGQVGSVTFSSSKTSVATVDANGFVTAVGKGSATITAKTYNGKKAKCTVKVVATTVEIRMADSVHINTEGFTDFPIEIVVASGQPYAGSVNVSIDPSDVAVYESGKLLGKLPGCTAILTVKAGGTTRTCNITVDGEAPTYSVKAIAHRGGAKWPENSIEAFENFSSTGADGVELDIRSTADAEQIVIHDEFYMANGVPHYVIREEYETVKALNPSICTLGEALDVIAKSGKEIYMNPKDTALGGECVKAIKARGLQSRTIYFCNNEQLLQEIYAADPSSVIGFSLSKGETSTGDAVVNKLKSVHASYIMPHYSLVTQEFVNYWHERGYKICAWTVDSKTTIRNLCAMGVDSILSNYPEYVVSVRSGG